MADKGSEWRRKANWLCRDWMRPMADDRLVETRTERGEKTRRAKQEMKKEVRAEAKEIEKAIDEA